MPSLVLRDRHTLRRATLSRGRLIEAPCYGRARGPPLSHGIFIEERRGRYRSGTPDRGMRLAGAARGTPGAVAMIQSLHVGTIVEMLLNSLEAERYVRGPLLCNVVDELSANASYAPAADLARALLEELERSPVPDVVFRAKLGELRECVRSLARGGAGVPRELARTTPRLVTGRSANAA
jgi:hypothetical protein